MEQKQSTAKGFAILGAAGIINKILAVMYVPILTLLIDDFGNGIYNAGYAMYLLVFVITNTGIPIAISKLVSEQIALGNYEDSHRTLKVSGILLILLGLATSIFTALGAKWLSNVVGWPEAYLTILALSPTMLFTAISCTYRGYFQGRSNMLPTGVSQIIEQLLNTVLTVVFAWLMLRYGIHYAEAHGIVDEGQKRLISLQFAAAGGTVGTSVGAMGSAIYLFCTYLRNRKSILNEIKENSNIKLIHQTSRVIAKRILTYAVPITIGSVAVYTANLIDLKYTKSRLITAGFDQYNANSLYGILTTQYQKILNIPLSIAAALAAAIIPKISAAAAVKDISTLGRRINESLKAILIITVPAAIGLAVLAEPIIRILFPRNVYGWDLMMMGSWVLILISVVQIQTAILQGIGKTHLPTIHMIVGLIVKILINYTLIAIPQINIKGAVIGSITCYGFACIWNHLSIKKHTEVKMAYASILAKPLAAAALMVICALAFYKIITLILKQVIASTYMLNLAGTLIAIAASCAAYFIVLIWLRGINSEDIRRVPLGRRINGILCKLPFFNRYLSE